MVAPVTKPAPVPSGRPSSSTSQRNATSSMVAVAGEPGHPAAFWSQVPASQFAATVAGSDPPVTQPKKRPPVVAIVAGDPASSSSASVAAGSLGPSGSASSKRANPWIAADAGATPRLSSVSR
jgi:hypothetical protein